MSEILFSVQGNGQDRVMTAGEQSEWQLTGDKSKSPWPL